MPFDYEYVLRRLALFEAITYLPNDYTYSTAPAGYTAEKEKFKRATRNEWTPYPGTTCGFLCSFLLWALNNRDPYTINRTDEAWNAEHPSKPDQLLFLIGPNITRLVADVGYKIKQGSVVQYTGTKAAFVKWTGNLNARPKMGDIVHIKTPDTKTQKFYDDHVFVFLKEDIVNGKRKWLTADMGQWSPWGEKWRLAKQEALAKKKLPADPRYKKNPYSFGCFNYRDVVVSGNTLKIESKTVQGWLNLVALPAWQWWPPSLPVIDLTLIDLLPTAWSQTPNEYGTMAGYKLAQDLAWSLAATEAGNLLNAWPYPFGDSFGGELWLWIAWGIYQTISGADRAGPTAADLVSLSSGKAVVEMSKLLKSQKVPEAPMNARELQERFETMQGRMSRASKQAPVDATAEG